MTNRIETQLGVDSASAPWREKPRVLLLVWGSASWITSVQVFDIDL